MVTRAFISILSISWCFAANATTTEFPPTLFPVEVNPESISRNIAQLELRLALLPDLKAIGSKNPYAADRRPFKSDFLAQAFYESALIGAVIYPPFYGELSYMNWYVSHLILPLYSLRFALSAFKYVRNEVIHRRYEKVLQELKKDSPEIEKFFAEMNQLEGRAQRTAQIMIDSISSSGPEEKELRENAARAIRNFEQFNKEFDEIYSSSEKATQTAAGKRNLEYQRNEATRRILNHHLRMMSALQRHPAFKGDGNCASLIVMVLH